MQLWKHAAWLVTGVVLKLAVRFDPRTFAALALALVLFAPLEMFASGELISPSNIWLSFRAGCPPHPLLFRQSC